jgi:hypothetical protein
MARSIFIREMHTMSAMKSTNARPKEAILFTWLAIISGAMLLGALLAFPSLHHINASTHWPVTNGVISAAGLKLYLHKPNIEPSYEPRICYSYVVDGIPRVGTRISFADSIRTFYKDAGIDWLSRNYPIGKTVTVYYDPADPDFSVLEPGAEDLIFIWRWVAGTLAFCVFLAIWMRSQALRRRQAPTPKTTE